MSQRSICMKPLDPLRRRITFRAGGIILASMTLCLFSLIAACGVSTPAASAVDAPSARAGTRSNGTDIRPFRVSAPDAALADLRQRIAATRWPDKENVPDRSQGVQLARLKALVGYWGTTYDWRKVEAKLNALPQIGR